jgi:gluconate:H+ symporter, GntP family
MNAGLLQISLALIVSIAGIVLLTRYLNLHAFFSLLLASIAFGLLVGKSFLETLNSMQAGFGSLLQQIGLLVAVGSCLGMMMEKTGAMEVIGHRIIKLFGIRYSVLSMTTIGIIVGIPVFCDSGFIILSRLISSIASQSTANSAQLSLALSSGLYTTHVLVPPTPGPLAAAANLNFSEHISTLILISLVASIPVAIVSYFFSMRFGRTINADPLLAELKGERSKISGWKAFLPLILPIVLIASASIPGVISLPGNLSALFRIMGHPVVALMIGLLLSTLLIQKKDTKEIPLWISTALKDAGIILLITGAGGAFGAVIKTSGIDILLKDYVSSSSSQGIIFLFIAFVISAILKTAQGSSTSSIIITSSLMAPLAATAGFVSPAQLSVLVIAIGGGAMTVSHANDSYFWVVSQFGGISPRDAFRSFTLLTFAQGITALIMSIILFLLV